MTPERWRKLFPNDQLRAIAAEIKRAEIWEREDRELYQAALTRALELVDLSLDEPRWKGESLMLLFLREELAKFYPGQQSDIGTHYAAI